MNKNQYILFNVLLFVGLLLSFQLGKSQTYFSFDSILNKKDILKKVNADLKKYRLQIIYTQITRDVDGKPSFKNYNYHVDSSNYFYCASLVKLPCSILALEKTKQLKIYSNTIMFTDSANACQHSVKIDTTSVNGYPSVAQYIKRMALVSDNFAYGRIYEFLGVDYIHDRLAELGYKNIRIAHRFDGGCKGTENTNTNPVTFYDNKLKPFIKLDAQVASKSYFHPLGEVKVGKAYMNAQNKKINQPKDFTSMNYMSLQNTHSILQRLIFSNYLPQEQRFDIIEDDREFLINHLTMYPRESSHPTYNPKTYFDSYKKYFIYGDSKKPITNSDIKITNIVGQSYGFMVDCAYIQNEKEHVEFMLSAVIYTNENQIINDGKYQYNTIALPFLAELGRQIYSFELKRSK
ncbi:MAG: serine hydrolase [Bacteroidia bacterium]|nr:serine hydrolase [Bacteroidia bacterium]